MSTSPTPQTITMHFDGFSKFWNKNIVDDRGSSVIKKVHISPGRIVGPQDDQDGSKRQGEEEENRAVHFDRLHVHLPRCSFRLLHFNLLILLCDV